MPIDYCRERAITVAQFADLLHRSALAGRRPVDDETCLAGMIAHCDLMISAWAGATLVGVARALTDFHYACYLSDLAVDRAYQRRGIGRTLIRRTQAALGPKCKLILVAAPDADAYYAHIGMERNRRCWVLSRDAALRE